MISLFNRYIDFILEENSLISPNVSYQNIREHISKLDKLLVLLLRVYLVFLSLISCIFFLKKFSKITDKQIKSIKKCLFLFNFFMKKIDQVFFVIISMHVYGNEGLVKTELQGPDKNKTSYRFIVVGSGPSGSVTALELSKKFPGEVLIIERGSSYEIPKSKHPGEEFTKKWYRGGVNSTYFPNMIAYSSGDCFGGGSEINSGLYHEPDSIFLDNWSKEHETLDLNLSSLEPFLEKIRPLTSKFKTNEIFSKKFIEGSLFNNDSFSELPRFIDEKSEFKNSMSKTLLAEFMENKGEVELSTSVKKISFENKKWEVVAKKNGSSISFTCDYLFLCCGSVFTNNLLLKSGIAKSKRHTIRKFKFHPMLKVIGSYDEDVQEINEDVIAHQNIQYYPKFIIGNASSSLQFLISSFQENQNIKKFIMKNWKRMKVFHATFSLGIGKIYRIPFFDEPLLTYKINKSEKNLMYTAFSKVLDFINKTGPQFMIPVMEKGFEIRDCENKESILRKAKSISSFQISSVHILGGVTMGENNKCVTDSYGKVKNYNNLYVNDSSLINTPLLKNPQGTVMVIAYRNIENFLQSL